MVIWDQPTGYTMPRDYSVWLQVLTGVVIVLGIVIIIALVYVLAKQIWSKCGPLRSEESRIVRKTPDLKNQTSEEPNEKNQKKTAPPPPPRSDSVSLA